MTYFSAAQNGMFYHYSGGLTTNHPDHRRYLGHDGDPLGVDGAEVGVLEQSHQVGLASFLKGSNSCRLESEVCLEILSNLPDLEHSIKSCRQSSRLTSLWKGSFLIRSSVDFW